MSWIRLQIEERNGTTVVVKRAATADQRRRLRREAALLTTVVHPGIVRLVDADEEGQELVTEHAGSATLADHHPPGLQAGVGVVAAVAGIIADLHRSGSTHGSLSADHVILGPMRHPVLCGLGSSTPASQEACAADLEGLAELIDLVLSACQPEPGRRGRRQQRTLASVAARCRTGQAPAHEVAAALATLGAGHGEPAPPAPRRAVRDQPGQDPAEDDHPSLGTRSWRHRVPPAPASPVRSSVAVRAGAAVAVAVVLASVWALRDRAAEPAVGAVLGAPTPSVEARTTAGPPTPVVTATPDPLRCGAATPTLGNGPGHDVDGDGCPDDVVVVGHLVAVDGRWFRAGLAGDVVRVGDWDCDGTATPAVLRPASGAVFVFDRWAEDEPMTVEPVARHPSATGLYGTTQGDRCGPPAVTDGSGRVIAVVSGS